MTQPGAKGFDYGGVPSGHYEKIIWQSHPIRRFWHRERFIRMQALLSTDERSALLDYGCASGSFFGFLTIPYARALGVDVAQAQLEVARRKYANARTDFALVDRLTHEPDDSFDYVIASEVIEHMSPQAALETLRTFHRLLKPGGKLLISTPNYHSPWPLVEFFVNRFSGSDYHHQHIHKLHRKNCLALLERGGFAAEHYSTLFVLSPFLAGLSEKAAHSLMHLEQSGLPNFGSLILILAAKKQPDSARASV